jgi:cytidylate kinase
MEPKTITISGPPASGTSTVAKLLADTLDYDLVNGGDIFRQMAKDRGVTLAELTEMSEKDPSIDKSLDDRLKERIADHAEGDSDTGLIAESRLAGWHGRGDADITVYLTAPRQVRLHRAEDRTESLEEFKIRETSERERYKEFYGVDYTDRDHYDIVINTELTGANRIAKSLKMLIQ